MTIIFGGPTDMGYPTAILGPTFSRHFDPRWLINMSVADHGKPIVLMQTAKCQRSLFAQIDPNQNLYLNKKCNPKNGT